MSTQKIISLPLDGLPDEQAEMDRLKAAGKEKTATYRQYFSNRLMYRMMLDRYKAYGLLDQKQ